MADSYDPSVIRGDTLRWTMYLKNSSGATINLSGSTLTMQIRSGHYPAKILANYSIGATNGSQLFSLDGMTGGLSVASTSGIISVCVGSNYTQNFPAYTPVFYDIQQQITSAKDTTTLLTGKIDTILDVTKT